MTACTTGTLARVLGDEGRERYLRVLAVRPGPAQSPPTDLQELLESALWRIPSIASGLDALVRGDDRVARAHVAWVLADVHGALAAESLAVGVDPDRRIDLVVFTAASRVGQSHRDSPVTRAFLRGTLRAAENDLLHACRFARSGGSPNRLSEWIAAGAKELLIAHVAASLLAAPGDAERLTAAASLQSV